jgi:hypothetical protein
MPGMVNTSFILDMQRKLYRWSVSHTLTTRSNSCARRAGCGETRTSGSESGMAKPTPKTGQGAPSRLYTEPQPPRPGWLFCACRRSATAQRRVQPAWAHPIIARLAFDGPTAIS